MKNNANYNITKELSDIARDFQLGQTKCQELYAVIGKQFFETNRENPPQEYANDFSQLEDQLRRLDNMDARRKFLNGIVVCTNCKADNGVELSFCASCGTRLPHKNAPVSDGNVRCANCGNVLKPGQAFCGACGTKAPEQKAEPVVEPAPVVAPAIEPTLVVAPVIEPAPVAEPIVETAATVEVVEVPKTYSAPVEESVSTDIVCNRCQNVITNPAALFCPECGNKVR